MNAVEKARLLHGFFPDDISPLLEFVSGVCQTIREHETEEWAKEVNGLLTFDFLLALVNDTEKRINKYGNRLCKNNRLFADQLFAGQNAEFMHYCLTLFTETKQHPHQRMVQLIRVLFETDKS